VGLAGHRRTVGERPGVVLVRILHMDVRPAVTDVTTVQEVGLVVLRDGAAAVPTDLGGLVALSDDLEAVDVV